MNKRIRFWAYLICFSLGACLTYRSSAQQNEHRFVAKDFTFVIKPNAFKGPMPADKGRYVDELEIYKTKSKKLIQTIRLTGNARHPYPVSRFKLEHADYNSDGHTDFRIYHPNNPGLLSYWLYNEFLFTFKENELLSSTPNIEYDSTTKSLTWLKQDKLTKTFDLFEYTHGKEKKVSQNRLEELFFDGKKTENYLMSYGRKFIRQGIGVFIVKIVEKIELKTWSCSCGMHDFHYILYKKTAKGWEIYLDHGKTADPNCDCESENFTLENNQMIHLPPIKDKGEYKLELTSTQGIVIPSNIFVVL